MHIRKQTKKVIIIIIITIAIPLTQIYNNSNNTRSKLCRCKTVDM
jgi:hypothetical protein